MENVDKFERGDPVKDPDKIVEARMAIGKEQRPQSQANGLDWFERRASEKQERQRLAAECERLAKAIAERNERRRKWLRPLGVFGRLATYAALFLILYAYSPGDISDKPLATLTLSDIFGTVAAFGFALVLGGALFKPSDDEEIKDLWGYVGVLILGGVAVGVVVLTNG
jgi:hypothetical protein